MDIRSTIVTLSADVPADPHLNVGILIALIILTILSAFFSMSETALSSVSVPKIKTLVEDRKNGSRKALYCIEHFEKSLTTLLVGNNIVNTAMSVISVTFFMQLFTQLTSDMVSILATIIITIVLLIFGEIIPKTIGKKYNESISCFVGPVLWFLSYAIYPLVLPFRGLQKLVTGHGKTSETHVDEDELGSILDTMEEDGSIEADEREMIKNVFDLNDQTVEDIMIPRVDMIAIDVESTIEEAKQVFFENKFSRIPVYREDKDHIIGILYERDFFSALLQKPLAEVTIENSMKPAKFVNKTMTVDNLIRDLQQSKMHMAIVSGEFNDTLGLVTMEDALEELVGEIYDEHDFGNVNNTLIHKVDDTTYIIDGDCDVDELFDTLNIGDAPDEAKVSSWIFESQEELPRQGDKMDYIACYTQEDEDGEFKDYAKKLSFEVIRVDKRRIEKVRLTISDATDEEVEEHNRLEDSE
ncbi:MAG: hemolysin family protein [Acholeplasmatales bacterium]|nr:hemolysin family protein [Acholeplasmatales bacterium]